MSHSAEAADGIFDSDWPLRFQKEVFLGNRQWLEVNQETREDKGIERQGLSCWAKRQEWNEEMTEKPFARPRSEPHTRQSGS